METIITYVPHGTDTDVYKPIDKNSPEYQEQNNILRAGNPERFILLWSNRNIQRKHGADVIAAYKTFCDKLVKRGGKYTKQFVQDNCLLVMHTAPTDPNGTDLPKIGSDLCPDYPIMFSPHTVAPEQLNILYNIADVTINIASNEGFGIVTIESLAAGTPIIVNVTGGLQDQCGFINPETNKYFTESDYINIGSLHDRRKYSDLKHGQWVKPVFASNRSLQGSIPTPYIFDDRADIVDVADAILYWYDTPTQTRERCGVEGRKYLLRSNIGMNKQDMCERVVRSIDTAISNFKPREQYELIKV
ncbi:putative glycosyltransferases [Microcystis phage Mel-JY01]